MEYFLKQLQLCRSVEEDDVKNTLLKFGLVTHLYDEVSKFRKSMKTLQNLTPKSKKKKKSGHGNIAKADKEVCSNLYPIIGSEKLILDAHPVKMQIKMQNVFFCFR